MQVNGGDQFIISPSYPFNYSNDLFCVWPVSVADDENARIKIHFE